MIRRLLCWIGRHDFILIGFVVTEGFVDHQKGKILFSPKHGDGLFQCSRCGKQSLKR